MWVNAHWPQHQHFTASWQWITFLPFVSILSFGEKGVKEELLKEWWGLIHLILTVNDPSGGGHLGVTLKFYSKYFHCIKILSVFLESHQSSSQVTVQLILFLTWTWQGFLSPAPGQCGLVFVLRWYRIRGQSVLQLICCYTTTTTLQTRALFHKVNWHYFKSDTWVIAWSLHIVCLIFLWKSRKSFGTCMPSL